MKRIFICIFIPICIALIIWLISVYLDSLAKKDLLPHLNWQFKAVGAIHSKLTIDSTSLFFTSTDGHLYSIDKLSGKLKYKIPLVNIFRRLILKKMESSPVIDGDLLFVGADYQYFYCIQKETGKIKWRYRIRGTHCEPVIVNDIVFIGTKDGILLALNKNNGHKIWRFKTSSAIYLKPLIIGTEVTFSNANGDIYSCNIINGKLNWKYKTKIQGYINSLSIAENNHLIFGFQRAVVCFLDRNQRKVIWANKLQTNFSTPLLYNGQAVFCGPSINAINMDDGNIVWTNGFYNYSDSELQKQGNYIITSGLSHQGYNKHFLVFLDSNTGKEINKIQIESEFLRAGIIENSSIYIGTRKGYVYSIKSPISF